MLNIARRDSRSNNPDSLPFALLVGMAALNFTYFVFSCLLVPTMAAAAGQNGNEAVKAEQCAVDTEMMMQLEPAAFDQDMNGGWRTLAARAGCEKATAALIQDYIDRNWHKLEKSSLHAMYWHAGQMEAVAGDYDLAKPLLMAGVNPSKRSIEMGFHDYALGTISFLNRDLAGLRAARQRLGALPEPAWFEAEFKGINGITWPANLSVLDGLVRCFESPYAVAYSDSCPTDQEAPPR